PPPHSTTSLGLIKLVFQFLLRGGETIVASQPAASGHVRLGSNCRPMHCIKLWVRCGRGYSEAYLRSVCMLRQRSLDDLIDAFHVGDRRHVTSGCGSPTAQVDGLPSLNLWSPPPSSTDVSTLEGGREELCHFETWTIGGAARTRC